jgi:hypothetical protein
MPNIPGRGRKKKKSCDEGGNGLTGFADGFDKDGFDRNGYDRKGRDRFGCDRDGDCDIPERPKPKREVQLAN